MGRSSGSVHRQHSSTIRPNVKQAMHAFSVGELATDLTCRMKQGYGHFPATRTDRFFHPNVFKTLQGSRIRDAHERSYQHWPPSFSVSAPLTSPTCRYNQRCSNAIFHSLFALSYTGCLASLGKSNAWNQTACAWFHTLLSFDISSPNTGERAG